MSSPSSAIEKSSIQHVENGHITADPTKDPEITEDVDDVRRNEMLNRRLHARVLPLCCWVYLLNFLHRGNIGNSKVLDEETGDSLLQQTNMTADGYALTATVFLLAYTLFEVPSNRAMKHYVRPSLWLAILLFASGALTIGFARVQNYATVVDLRFFIGVFEAGFFQARPSLTDKLGSMLTSQASSTSSPSGIAGTNVRCALPE
jgi:MFS family permease